MWRQADKYNVPRICFVNKMDRIGANFYRCVEMIKDRLGAVPLVCQLPIGVESDFVGVVDLVEMKAIIWNDETLGAEFHVSTIPADLLEQATEYRANWSRRAVEQDDAALEAYLDGKEPDVETLKRCIRKGTIAYAFVPGALRLRVQEQGRAAAARRRGRLPAGADRRRRRQRPQDGHATRRWSARPPDDEPFAGLAFKIMNDPFVGTLTFVRVYSGVLRAGSQCSTR